MTDAEAMTEAEAQEMTEAEAPDELGLDAWRAFVRGHARVLAELDAELRRDHGLTR